MPEQDEVALPELPAPLITMRRIRGCEGEAAAQLALESFAISYARTAVLAERERCARLCDSMVSTDTDWDHSFWDQAVGACAAAIRKGTP